MKTICPRCEQFSLQRDENMLEEMCFDCGYARSFEARTQRLVYECGGYGRISYVDGRSGKRVMIPFTEPIKRPSAKRAFLKFFRERANIKAEKREVSWFDCERKVLEKYTSDENAWKKGNKMQQALCDDGKNRWEDTFFCQTEDEEKFLLEVEETELETLWLEGIPSREIRLAAIPSLIETGIISEKYGLNLEKTYSNAEDGTGLILNCSNHWYNVSSIARSTLYETAKIWGSALGRMSYSDLAEILNKGLRIARGDSLILIRQGKVMALHSSGNYCVMPISDLIGITKQSLAAYGQVVFSHGYHSNQYTMAVWSLPDIQEKLLAAYRDALLGTTSRCQEVNFIPAVCFSASDTAHSAASLKPVFLKTNGVSLSFNPGICVKHERKRTGELYGLDLYEQEVGTIYDKFQESMGVLRRMAAMDIYHPVNCVVGLFNWINRKHQVIPRKYADVIRQQVENISINAHSVSAHDIYLSMVDCVALAQQGGASLGTWLNMSDAIAKVLTVNWTKFDVGGSVAWGDKQSQ